MSVGAAGCPNPYKESFSELDRAKRAARTSSFPAGVYRCECGYWHISGSGGDGRQLHDTPSRHHQRKNQRKKSKTPCREPPIEAAEPLTKAARKIDEVLAKARQSQQQHDHRYVPLRETADGLGVVEVCKKCRAYRVAYQEEIPRDE